MANEKLPFKRFLIAFAIILTLLIIFLIKRAFQNG